MLLKRGLLLLERGHTGFFRYSTVVILVSFVNPRWSYRSLSLLDRGRTVFFRKSTAVITAYVKFFLNIFDVPNCHTFCYVHDGVSASAPSWRLAGQERACTLVQFYSPFTSSFHSPLLTHPLSSFIKNFAHICTGMSPRGCNRLRSNYFDVY